MKRVFLDSDIFVRDLRYPRDTHAADNQRLIDRLRRKAIPGATSIFNVLEVCGILSFNLTEQELLGLYANFPKRYGVKILFPADATGQLQYDIPAIFQQMLKKQSLGDAQIASAVQRFADHLAAFISWNARHFADKLAIPALTPAQYLSRSD
ncbi:MAG: hypothetical protein HY696_09145 [Deltaproteobacteria bacterium]|nr:hypothetical protein [Deltaproteobacteria bacterium]